MNELDGMETFIAVADAKGFRAAGERPSLRSEIWRIDREARCRLGEVIDQEMIAVAASAELLRAPRGAGTPSSTAWLP